MKFVRWLLIVVLLALIGLYGYTYSRNPSESAMVHADAVGFVLARPLSGGAWRGLACPHRTAVNELVAKSLGPKLCGHGSDGGAAKRARRFQTEGPVSCWALFEQISKSYEARFSDIIAKKAERTPAANDICRRAEALVKS